MSSDEQGYNGWSNYPTWCVNLWLSNDEGLYRATQELAISARSVAPAAENVEQGIWTVGQTERFRLADQLKDWVRDELAPDLGASFAADLLGYAFDQVNWHEIAGAWLEEVPCPT